MVKARSDAVRFGILIYDGVEPIDLGGTLGVISMARRVVPHLGDAVIAPRAGPVRMSGGLVVTASFGAPDAPACDVIIVCGGPGWPQAAADPCILDLLRRQPDQSLASVCTGALILAATGRLDERAATTRRAPAGAEAEAPLARLARRSDAPTPAAAIVDDGIVTGGGVSLAIDLTLYLIGRFYGPAVQDEVARTIEYDRAYAANASALGLHRVAAR